MQGLEHGDGSAGTGARGNLFLLSFVKNDFLSSDLISDIVMEEWEGCNYLFGSLFSDFIFCDEIYGFQSHH